MNGVLHLVFVILHGNAALLHLSRFNVELIKTHSSLTIFEFQRNRYLNEKCKKGTLLKKLPFQLGSQFNRF